MGCQQHAAMPKLFVCRVSQSSVNVGLISLGQALSILQRASIPPAQQCFRDVADRVIDGAHDGVVGIDAVLMIQRQDVGARA
jgi:hypothetical protein